MKPSELLNLYASKITQLLKEKHTYEEVIDYLEKQTGINVSKSSLSKHIGQQKRLAKRQRKPSIDSSNVLTLFLNYQPFGDLSRSSDGIYHFSYDEAYRGEKLFKTGLYDALPPFIDNLLPEGSNLRDLEQSVGSSDKFILLQHISDTFGGFTTSAIEKKIPLYGDHFFSFVKSLRSKEEIHFDIPQTIIEKKRFNNSFEGEEKLSKLSGAQPKLSVVFSNNQLRLQDGFEHSNALLKVDNIVYQDLNIIENMLLTFARLELKFETVLTTLIIDEQKEKGFLAQTHLLVKRFDRQAPSTLLEAYEASALLNIQTDDKYELELSVLFEGLKKYIGTEELATLALQLFFSYLVGNGDHHSKNISLLKENGHYTLSPLYDVVTTKIYPALAKDDLGMLLNGRQVCKPNEIMTFLKQYTTVEELQRVYTVTTQRLFAYIESSPFDHDVAKKLVSYYTQHFKQVGKLFN
jgi:serine/threonine-protein kinase HipA